MLVVIFAGDDRLTDGIVGVGVGAGAGAGVGGALILAPSILAGLSDLALANGVIRAAAETIDGLLVSVAAALNSQLEALIHSVASKLNLSLASNGLLSTVLNVVNGLLGGLLGGNKAGLASVVELVNKLPVEITTALNKIGASVVDALNKAAEASQELQAKLAADIVSAVESTLAKLRASVSDALNTAAGLITSLTNAVVSKTILLRIFFNFHQILLFM